MAYLKKKKIQVFIWERASKKRKRVIQVTEEKSVSGIEVTVEKDVFKPEENLDKEKESKQLFSGVTSPKIDESTSNLIPSKPALFIPEDNFGKRRKTRRYKSFRERW